MTTVPRPGGHGGDGERVARALGLDPRTMLDLSASLNPVAADPGPIIARHLDALGRYPDDEEAHAALSYAMGVDGARLLLTNGGAEAIALVASELGGSVEEPEFSLHPRGAGPRWRSNPHNPSGVLAPASARVAVWDEAFYPLATGRWTRGDHDTVVVGSLTKLLACPGLRVGYVLAEPSFIERCRRRQPAWAVNGLAAAALPELLAPLDLAHDHAAIVELRSRLRTSLEAHGLHVRESDANWVLVERTGLRDALAPTGVVVRDCSSFGLPELARVAVPDDEGRARLDQALRTIDDWLVTTERVDARDERKHE